MPHHWTRHQFRPLVLIPFCQCQDWEALRLRFYKDHVQSKPFFLTSHLVQASEIISLVTLPFKVDRCSSDLIFTVPAVDEILYHARVHPEQRCNTLTESQIAALHLQTAEICRIAVEAKADDSKFPEDWLFKHRWVWLYDDARLLPHHHLFRRGRGKSRNILWHWFVCSVHRDDICWYSEHIAHRGASNYKMGKYGTIIFLPWSLTPARWLSEAEPQRT